MNNEKIHNYKGGYLTLKKGWDITTEVQAAVVIDFVLQAVGVANEEPDPDFNTFKELMKLINDETIGLDQELWDKHVNNFTHDVYHDMANTPLFHTWINGKGWAFLMIAGD